LLCRLYDPTDGCITIDGVDLRDVDLAALRHQISIVFQDYVHYNLSVEDNIWFGNVEQPPDREQVIAAAKKSGIDPAIQLLKEGYDTTLGKLFQDGAELSIGQWQKIALARAFLRTSPILILDEPTSALDAIAEFEVFQQFRQLVENRTAILISHRLSTVKMADVIYVIQEGQVVESGSHDELMVRNGYYAHLFKTQAQSYNLTPDS
jgi:ATP-binding cassette subfamily B protein